MKKLTLGFSLLLTLFFAFQYCFAQQSNLGFYTTKNGLPYSTVNSIYQDRTGYVWIATDGGGLSRFNGTTFENFTKKNGLPCGNFTTISEDHIGNMWFGTFGCGLVKYDGKRFKTYTAKDGLLNEIVYSIYVDDLNTLWLATFGGILKYDGKNFSSITTKEGLPTDEILSLASTKNKKLIIGTQLQGLCTYDSTGKILKFTKEDGLTNGTIFSMKTDSKGRTWIGTGAGGVCVFNGKKIVPFKISEDFDKAFITSIIEDKRGNIWFSSTTHGIVKCNNKSFKFFTRKNGLPDNNINCLMEDFEGNIWIGTATTGICVLHDEGVVTFTEKDGLKNNSSNTVFINNENSVLVGTRENGMYLEQNDELLQIPLNNILSKQDIICFNENSSGELWMGSANGANGNLLKLKKKKKEYILVNKLETIKKHPLLYVTNIVHSDSNNMWVSSYGLGLINIHNSDTSIFDISNGLPSNDIMSLYYDNYGNNLWIGTNNNGLVKYDGKTFKNYTVTDNLCDNYISAITGDKKGTIYIGSRGGGFSILNNEKLISYSTPNGLFSDKVNSIMLDSKKHLWLGTDKGVDIIAFKSDLEIKTIKRLGEKEGLKGIEVTMNGLAEDAEGNIWISTNEGLVRYTPELDYVNSHPPVLVLKNIRLNFTNPDWKTLNVNTDDKTGLPLHPSLSYKNNHLTFDFEALTIDNVKFSYQLEGQDKSWSPLRTENFVTYSNISPGDYIFKVKAINSDGYWSDKIIEYPFTINPPWYNTWWFYSTTALALIGGAIGFTRYKTRQLKKQKILLEQKVTERTLELKSANDKLSVALTDISDSINYAKKIQEAILPISLEFKQLFPNSFILFYPRNVVSGDFYWFLDTGNKIFVAAVDCTGHGVPGAFMSMIGTSLLNEIAERENITNAADALDELNVQLRKALKQDREAFESKDGMDLAICVIDKKTSTVDYAGAKRPIFLARKNDAGYELQQIKGDRYSIGGMQIDKDFRFTNHSIQLKKGERFYIFSDGFVDQFGGLQGKKLTTKRFEQHLLSIQSSPMTQHQNELSNLLKQWQGNNEQVDDILVIGIEL